MRFAAERDVSTPHEDLYALLADYHIGHLSILPAAFSNFAVIEGGVGAGTRIRFDLQLGGRKQTARGLVSEPEPGRVLVETYEDGTTTRFTVAPTPAGSHLTIETVWESSAGPAGWLERLMAPRLLKPLYRDELDRIEAWARSIDSAR